MAYVISSDDISGCTSLNFKRSMHEKDNRNITANSLLGSSDIVLAKSGYMFSNKTEFKNSVTITIEGGVDKFVNEDTDYDNIYVTDSQLWTLQDIIIKAVRINRNLNISADEWMLDDMLKAVAVRSA